MYTVTCNRHDLNDEYESHDAAEQARHQHAFRESCSLAIVEPVNSRQHLDAIPDGCGCAEVWEALSEQREG